MTNKIITNKVESRLSHTVNTVLNEYPNFSERIRFLWKFYVENNKNLHTIDKLADTCNTISKQYKEVVNRFDMIERKLEKKSKW